uniref:VWFC domain-containing protein n=1 Tax=Nothoprocta perdicaria TaxID=30464 RepID=A0A8C6ZI42_NOTPE
MGILLMWLRFLFDLQTLPQGSPPFCGEISTWKPDSCQDCRCQSGVVTCEPVVCKHPSCDFQKGEVLQIAPNKCCPTCASRAEGFCQHEGQTHGHGTQWAGSGCSLCFCAHGKVNCTPEACPALACGSGELQYTARGACCPTCVGLGESCSFDGRSFRDGEAWRLSQCSKCICRDGATQCFVASCQPVLCSQVRAPPGRYSRLFHGEQWKKNACTTCACSRGEVRCLRETCESITCEKGATKVQRWGKCCAECVAAKGSCFYEGTIRYHSDMWNSTRCDFCMCDRGQVACQKAECARVECAKVRKVFPCKISLSSPVIPPCLRFFFFFFLS